MNYLFYLYSSNLSVRHLLRQNSKGLPWYISLLLTLLDLICRRGHFWSVQPRRWHFYFIIPNINDLCVMSHTLSIIILTIINIIFIINSFFPPALKQGVKEYCLQWRTAHCWWPELYSLIPRLYLVHVRELIKTLWGCYLMSPAADTVNDISY